MDSGFDGLGDDEVEGHGPINLVQSSYVNLHDYKKNDSISILSINARSINNKFQQLRNLVGIVGPTVFCVQETWGKNAITDYSISGYQKPEISARIGNMNAGGGVGMWLKNNTEYKILSSPFTEKQIETQTIHLLDLNLVIVNVYRPLGNCVEFITEFIAHISQVRETHPADDIIVVGDLNIDLSQSTNRSDDLVDSMVTLGFIQQITVPTRVGSTNNSIIDHVYTKSKRTLKSDVIVSDISDHFATITKYPRWRKKDKKIAITKRWLTQQSYQDLEILLKGEKWDDLDDKNLDQMTNSLTQTIQNNLDLIAPIKTKIVREEKDNMWITKGIIVSSKKNEKLYRQYKKTKKLEDKERYKKRKKLLDKVVKAAKNIYLGDQLLKAGSDSRKLWGLINKSIDRKQLRDSIPKRIIIENQSVRGNKNIANEFNKYFAGIGKEMAAKLPDNGNYIKHLQKYETKFKLRLAEQTEVEKIMADQQPKLSCGTDTINNRIVKTCAKILSIPMTKIINKSIVDGKVPELFKKALIKPLYKKGQKNVLGNYRPVSLLSALSKILEKIICKQLLEYLDENDILCKHQYGFRNKSGTTHAVQSLLNMVTENSSNNQPTIAAFLDLSKAFDCLQYDKLYTKLEYMGIQGNELEWFKNYLTNRTQCVEIDGTTSDLLPVELGVPQGSILGPILFLIYVNDLNSTMNSPKVKFADDTTPVATGSTIDMAEDNMNNMLKDVATWFTDNKLNLNPSKTKYIVFNNKLKKDTNIKINDIKIERIHDKGKEKSFKLLGIHLDENLKWNEHINSVGNKISSALYGLTKVARELTTSNKKLLYSGLIHSHLVYGLPIWGFATKGRLNSLLVKQKRAIRKVFNLHYRDHTLPYFIQSGILQLPELIKHTTLCYMQAGTHETAPKHIKTLWPLKNKRDGLRNENPHIEYQQSNKQWINNLPSVAQAKLWNNDGLDKNVKPTSFKSLSKKGN